MKRFAALVAAGAAWAAVAAELPAVEASEPRAFGYQVGDLVQRHVSVVVPAGWSLDETTLPRAGVHGMAIELRRLVRSSRDGGRRVELDLEYQVMVAPVNARTYEIAAWRARLLGPGRAEELRVEAAPVTVAPLVPVEVSPRRGLGPMQPDREPPLLDVSAWHLRLWIWAALALPFLGWLAAIHIGLPWVAARRRPFGLAWRQLRRLPTEPAMAEWRAACLHLHEALNRSAGEAVFDAGLARFLGSAPRFALLREDLARFLAMSRREFFGGGGCEPGDAAWLVVLARRLRDAERGGR